MAGRRRVLLASCICLTVVVGAKESRAADAPDWLLRAAQTELRPEDRRADAVVLLDDVAVTVAGDGRLTSKRRFALRVLTADGGRRVAVREVYTTDAGEVRVMRGWTLRDGHAVEVDKRVISDISIVANDVYNEARIRVIAPHDLEPNVIVGVETEVVERVPYPQLDWALQAEWPVRVARRQLTLPDGWEARSLVFNHAPVAPRRQASPPTLTWEVRDLPAVMDEVFAPSISSRAARLAVTYGTASGAPALDDWVAVSHWLADLTDRQATASPALAAKAKELTASATTDLEKIRAIGQYVQRVQYISIQTGLGRGGGYKPHAAADVFAKNYGDCKDKANLMRAMLEVLGIQSRLVAIYLGDPEYVRAEWASPQQFNHCIIAIRVGTEVQAYPVLEHATLGRLLFFDPTDEDTPVGELPVDEQNSYALVMASPGVPIVRVPAAPVAATRVLRRVEGRLSPEGELVATLQDVSAGAAGTLERRTYRALGPEAYFQAIGSAAQRTMAGTRLTAGPVRDDAMKNEFQVTVGLAVPGFAQTVGGGLMLVRAPRTSRDALPQLPPDAERTAPIKLSPLERREHVSIDLPQGVDVDELPAAHRTETPFGFIGVRWSVENRRLVRDLTVRIHARTIPASEYRDIYAFLTHVVEAEAQPAVLIRR